MAARCPHCSETTPPDAKFCPRCGKTSSNGQAAAHPPSTPHRSIDLGKMSAPLPLAGVLFLAALVLGPAAILVGVVAGIKLLIYVGAAILVALVALLLLGELF